MRGNYSKMTGWFKYRKFVLFADNGVIKHGLYLTNIGMVYRVYPIRVKGDSVGCRRCLLEDGYYKLAVDIVSEKYVFDFELDRFILWRSIEGVEQDA